MERCRKELVKAGYIEEGTEARGRDKTRRALTANRKVIGGVLAAGGSGEKHWFRETGNGYEVDITIDSGAVATIVPPGTVPGEVPRETEASRRGMSHMVANGEAIANIGELTLRGKAENGAIMNVIAQVSEVTKPLGAVREIIKAVKPSGDGRGR